MASGLAPLHAGVQVDEVPAEEDAEAQGAESPLYQAFGPPQQQGHGDDDDHDDDDDAKSAKTEAQSI